MHTGTYVFLKLKSAKKMRNPHLLILWRRRMTGTTYTDKTRRILILESMVEAMFERSPDYFKQFRKNFRFLFKEKPKAEVDFPLDVVISICYTHLCMMGFVTLCQTITIMFWPSVLVKIKRGNPKITYYHVYIQPTPY